MNYARRMEWKKLVSDLRTRGITFAEIAKECGFASAGAVHDLTTDQKTVNYERGARLVEFHRKMMKRKKQ